jgi:hypothetical protein
MVEAFDPASGGPFWVAAGVHVSSLLKGRVVLVDQH